MTAPARSTATSARPRVDAGPTWRWSLIALAVLVAVSLDVHLGGPLTHLDHQVADRMTSWDLRGRPWPRRALTVGVWFGQRGVVLVGAVLILGAAAGRHRTVEPLLRLVVALVGLIAVVYAFKLGLARNAPVQDARGDPAGTGASFPSGHVANAVLLWGLASWSVRRWPVPEMLGAAVRYGRWVAPVAVTVAMTLLNYHWLTDLVGGAAVGVVLLGTTLLPLWSRPAAALDRRWRRQPADD